MAKPLAPWLCLALVVALYLFYWASARPADHFGRYHDDTILFGSAQALARGQGYVLPSLPGSPPQSKYPVLFPWLLSWIWKWHPAFPENVATAVWVTAAFGCWFLVAAFLLLRQLGLGDWMALLVTALCAFHTLFVFLSGLLLSDVPFFALALTAVVIADRALGERARPWSAVAAGLFTGLSMLTRSLGVAVFAGILVCALCRRAHRQAAWFGAAAIPLAAFAALWPARQAPGAEWAAGWRQVWLYYTSYWEFWKLSVPDWSTLRAMLSFNALSWLEWPSTFCFFSPPGRGESFAGHLLSITLTAGILAGIAREGKRRGWRPLHFAFVFYSAAVVLWNYALMDRFLMVFLPLYFAGMYWEGGHLVSLLRRNLASGRPLAEKALAALMGAGVLALAVASATHYLAGQRGLLLDPSTRRYALAPDQVELYDWIRRSTPPAARFVAYRDVRLYLHTARQAVRPVAFSSAAFYKQDEAILRRDLAHIADAAWATGAQYWVVSSDDFDVETGGPAIEQRMAELKSALPVVFRTAAGKIEVHDLGCLQQPERAACGAAVATLFPPGPP